MSIFIIAEIGINHNGDIELAKQLIDVAKNAGADAVFPRDRIPHQFFDQGGVVGV